MLLSVNHHTGSKAQIFASAKIKTATDFMQAHEPLIATVGGTRSDVSVPETDVKRMRI